jgi:hypothetical protein
MWVKAVKSADNATNDVPHTDINNRINQVHFRTFNTLTVEMDFPSHNVDSAG